MSTSNSQTPIKLTNPHKQKMFLERARLWSRVFENANFNNTHSANNQTFFYQEAAVFADATVAEFDKRFPIQP